MSETNTNSTNESQTTVNQDTDQTTSQSDEPKVEHIEKSKYDSVLSESIGRKEKIRQLEAQLESYKALAPEGSTPEEQLKSLNSQIKKLQKENEKLNQLGSIREKVSQLGAIDARVAELAYEDLKKAGALGSSELENSFLESWKNDHKTFFKQSEPESPITKPLPAQVAKQEKTPASLTPSEEFEAYKKLPMEEKLKLSPGYIQKMEEMRGSQINKR